MSTAEAKLRKIFKFASTLLRVMHLTQLMHIKQANTPESVRLFPSIVIPYSTKILWDMIFAVFMVRPLQIGL